MRTDSLAQSTDLLRIYLRPNWSVGVEISPWLIAALIIIALLVLFRWYRRFRRHFSLVKLEIDLGGVGKAEFQPNVRDIQIAHTIWTELVTRKAAIPIDPEHDVIVEIYNSWYTLFGRIRQLISDIPATWVRQEHSTRELVRISTDTLNNGLRPHLTRWQARFRNWYANQSEALKSKTPQEVQKSYPDYSLLIKDMLEVNRQLIQYSVELQKLVQGNRKNPS
jgi:hypothetical protein